MDCLAQVAHAITGLPIWKAVGSFLNSNFTAALAGALAGALAAQKIADRSKQREELLREIRSTNSAIMLCFTVINAGLALKGQYVKSIYENFTAARAALDAHRKRRAAGEIPRDQPFEFQADFRSLQMPLIPIDLLRTQLSEGISGTRRAMAAAMTLAGAAQSLSETIQRRNALIERHRALGKEGDDQLLAFYFGLPYQSGRVSTEYPDTIEALHRLTDDVVFFGNTLSADLADHGNQLLADYKKVAKNRKEKIISLDFSEAEGRGLMPNRDDYANWLGAFPDASGSSGASKTKKRLS